MYKGEYAKFYDLIYSEKQYGKEAAFINRILKEYCKASKYLLEIACGTGNHAFELEKYGYNIMASDYSKDMINQARFKAKQFLSSVQFHRINMVELPEFGKKFDAALCLFDSIGYVLTNAGISKVLIGVHKNLRKNGIFIFEFWHGAAMIKYYDAVRIKKFKTGDCELVRKAETSIDYKNQTGIVNYTINGFKKDGTYHQIVERHYNRFFLPQEMNLFLASCNFTLIKYFNGYAEKEQIDDKTWHILAVARKN